MVEDTPPLVAATAWARSWRTAADDINWRRFFDINELGGLRVERPAVFEATHAKIFELIAQGLIDGLRIDHILVSEGLRTDNARAMPAANSDHLALAMDIDVPDIALR